MMIQRKWIVGSIVFLLLLLSLFFFQDDQTQDALVIEPMTDEDSITNDMIETTEESSTIWVDVKGEVKHPGVYEMEAHSRVKDVIEQAGGLLDDANETAVNMAELLYDEMVVFVPKVYSEEDGADVGEGVEAVDTAPTMPSKVRINTATKEELMTLPGIGEAKANVIIEYREANGRFSKPEDLLNISGIGEKTLENFADQIIVP